MISSKLFSFSNLLIRFCKQTSIKCISTSQNFASKGRTYESSPVPGSEDDVSSLNWAERLFELKELRKKKTVDQEPSPILMISRLKPLKGLTFFEKGFLEKYGIGQSTKKHTWVLVKNTPQVAVELDTIKHVIKVQPISFTDGLPSSQEDLINFRLLPNGKFVRRGFSTFRPGKPVNLEAAPILKENSPNLCNKLVDNSLNRHYLTRGYLRGWHNQRWHHHKLFSEFFTSHYKYRLNQDGQEYRYSRLWRLDDAMQQSIKQRTNPDGTYKSRNNSRYEADWNTYPWAFY